jgi:hypothetical protein
VKSRHAHHGCVSNKNIGDSTAQRAAMYLSARRTLITSSSTLVAVLGTAASHDRTFLPTPQMKLTPISAPLSRQHRPALSRLEIFDILPRTPRNEGTSVQYGGSAPLCGNLPQQCVHTVQHGHPCGCGMGLLVTWASSTLFYRSGEKDHDGLMLAVNLDRSSVLPMY